MSANSAEYMREYRKRTNPGKKARALAYLGGRCIVCGSVDDLHFHHIDPTSKAFEIATGMVHRSWANLVIEMDKCELRCAACHIDEHRSTAPCGTAQRYWRGCRCEPCRAARNAHQRAYKLRRNSSSGQNT